MAAVDANGDAFLDDARSEAFVEAGAEELEFLFVRGMPGIITQGGKVGHVSWEIANSKRVIFHSFSHDPADMFEMPAAAKLPAAAGKIFTIQQPLFINVQLFSKDEGGSVKK